MYFIKDRFGLTLTKASVIFFSLLMCSRRTKYTMKGLKSSGPRTRPCFTVSPSEGGNILFSTACGGLLLLFFLFRLIPSSDCSHKILYLTENKSESENPRSDKTEAKLIAAELTLHWH